MTKDFKIITPDGAEPSLEIMAENIEKIAALGASIAKSRLREKVILLVLKDATGVPMGDIKKILDVLPELKKLYLK